MIHSTFRNILGAFTGRVLIVALELLFGWRLLKCCIIMLPCWFDLCSILMLVENAE